LIARHPAIPPSRLPSSSCPSSHSCPPAIAVPRFLLLFPLDCACRGRLVGEGNFVREGRASASRRRGNCRQGGLWVLVIKADSWSCHHGVYHQRRVPSRRVRVLETGQRRINLASHSCCGRQSSHGSSWLWVYRCLTGKSGLESLLERSDLGSLHALQVG